MAGNWRQTTGKTGMRGVYWQIDKRTGKRRYKAVYRDARGATTSQTFSPNEWSDPLRQVKRHLTDIHTARAKGTLPDVSKERKTVAELWDHFLKTSRARPSTRAWYTARWTKHVKPIFGIRKIGTIKRSEIEEFYADLEAKTSLATRRAVQQLVHKLLAVAVRSEWLQRNPADGIEMPAARTRQPRFLTENEVRKIADEVPHRYRVLVWTLAVAGLRVGEATALRVKDINGTIRVRENSPEVGGRKIIGPTKTDGSERIVPVPPFLRQLLHDHLDQFQPRWRFTPDAFVFTGEHGGQVRQGNFRKRVFQQAARRVKLNPVPTVHDLRHSSASLWLKAGLSTFEVAKLLGHSTTAMVEKTYGHLYEAPLQEKVDRLEGVFA